MLFTINVQMESTLNKSVFNVQFYNVQFYVQFYLVRLFSGCINTYSIFLIKYWFIYFSILRVIEFLEHLYDADDEGDHTTTAPDVHGHWDDGRACMDTERFQETSRSLAEFMRFFVRTFLGQ